ncbi:hypothetical protein JCM8547_000551 [Rhodosporidiobolus lusitaniae]
MPPSQRRPTSPAWLLPLALSFCTAAAALSTSSSTSTSSPALASFLFVVEGSSAQEGPSSAAVRSTTVTATTTGGLETALAAESATLGAAETGGLTAARTGKVNAVATASVTASAIATEEEDDADVDVSVSVEVEDEDEDETTSAKSRTRSSSSRTSSRTSTSRLTLTTSASRLRTTAASRAVSTASTNSTVSAISARRSSSTRTSSRLTTTTSSHSRSRTTASPALTTATQNLHASSRTVTTTTRSRSKTTSHSKSKSTTTKKSSSSHKTSSTSSAKASPTSYGYVKSASCVEPPSTFAGTDEGFAHLCTRRYCDATKSYNMAWAGNSGNVTRKEIETALGMLADIEPVWENGQGNILSDGEVGQALYNAGLLFELTGDVRALDVVVRIADNILALQNQNTANPVTIWTGEVDPVWPTKDLPPKDGQLVYAGCENGLIVGHMVSAAVMILKSPCLWDVVPPVFSGPTVFNDSVTYYDRAKAYIAAGDDTYENYFFRFLDPNLSLIQPADERWWLTGDTRDPGTPMPWNRRMMMIHGYLRLAAAHETAAAYDANLTSKYDTVAQMNVQEFLRDLNETKAIRGGEVTFDWDYAQGENNDEESQGVHAYFDIWGAWQAWQRNSATFGLSNYIGQTFANTFENTISFGNGTFAGLVTGSSTKKAYSISTLWGGWTFYALWAPEWFDTVASANVDVGFRGRTWMAIPLLWTKHALASDDLTFWSGRFSSGYGVISGTSGTSSSSSSTSAGVPLALTVTARFTVLAGVVAFLLFLL